MLLTMLERKRLAREARKLAMAALEGRARFGRWYSPYKGQPACPLGRLFGGYTHMQLVDLGLIEWGDVFAESLATPAPSSDSFTFPLLALADVLEGK